MSASKKLNEWIDRNSGLGAATPGQAYLEACRQGTAKARPVTKILTDEEQYNLALCNLGFRSYSSLEKEGS